MENILNQDDDLICNIWNKLFISQIFVFFFFFVKACKLLKK